MGLTEDSDAVVVVVSEETGEISVAHRGHLVQGLDPDGLRAFLTTTLTSVPRRTNWLAELGRRVFGNLGVREVSSGTEVGLDTKVEGFEGHESGTEAEHDDERRKEARR
jgi:hypothetical protein